MSSSRYPEIMSAADGWDLTVPEDGTELLAELRRHGIRPGQRLHVVPTAQRLDDDEHRAAEDRPKRRLSFTASGRGEADLGRKTDEYLKGFGEA